MTATAALRSARNAGVRVRVDAGDLVLEAPAAPPTAVLDALRRHKAEIVFLLDVGSEAWSSEDWCEFYDERVAIAEFDGGLSPTHAVDLAFRCCSAERRRRQRAATYTKPPGPREGQ